MSIENTTNETTIVTLNAVEEMARDFQTRMTKDHETHFGLQVQGWEVTWKQVAEAYRVARAIMAKGNEELLKQALKNAGILEAGPSANKWLPVTKLLFGKWNAAETVFCLDRSAEKYANYLRYFERHNITEQDVFGTIQSFDHDDYGRYLKGIEKADRAEARSANGKTAIDTTTALDLGSDTTLRDVAVFDVPKDFAAANATMGTTLFKIEDGKIILFGSSELKEADFETRLTARGKKLIAANKKVADSVASANAVRQVLARQAA